MKTSLAVGDRVAYSKVFLRSINAYTGPMPFARGAITALINLGETTLAAVDWNDPEIPGRVNVANLVRVRDIPKEEP